MAEQMRFLVPEYTATEITELHRDGPLRVMKTRCKLWLCLMKQ